MTRVGRAGPGQRLVISVWCARIDGPPAYIRGAGNPHYAASLIKLAVLLEAQAHPSPITAALPAGTRAGSKGGWVPGVRHDAAIIYPDDAPAYVLTVCTSGLTETGAETVIAAVARASWADRHHLTGPVAPAARVQRSCRADR
jgi:beta-lactamase class A